MKVQNLMLMVTQLAHSLTLSVLWFHCRLAVSVKLLCTPQIG